MQLQRQTKPFKYLTHCRIFLTSTGLLKTALQPARASEARSWYTDMSRSHPERSTDYVRISALDDNESRCLSNALTGFYSLNRVCWKNVNRRRAWPSKRQHWGCVWRSINWMEWKWIEFKWIEFNWIQFNSIILNWIHLNWTEFNWNISNPIALKSIQLTAEERKYEIKIDGWLWKLNSLSNAPFRKIRMLD